jgi:hypothetical protein
MTVVTPAEDLRAKLLGAWTLVSYETRTIDGTDVTYPFGPDPQGTVLYTADGFMSAQVMRPRPARFEKDDLHQAADSERALAAEGYVAYSGPFSVSEDGHVVTHHVSVSLFPNWLGQAQSRVAKIDGSRLELAPTEPILVNGELREAHLIWQRP